jgi:hypothetical protein
MNRAARLAIGMPDRTRLSDESVEAGDLGVGPEAGVEGRVPVEACRLPGRAGLGM